MKTNFLSNLKNRVGKIAEYDKAIESRKAEVTTKARSKETPETLLMQKMAEIQREKEVEVLEGLKKDIKEKEVLDNLIAEYTENLVEAQNHVNGINELCEAAKQKYTETLKAYNKEYDEVINNLAKLCQEYKQEAYKLGFTEEDIRNELHYNIGSSPAEIVAAEHIFLV